MSVSPARLAAFRILNQIETAQAFSSNLLAAPETEALDPRDRGLCHELTLGVLRRRMLLDALIDVLAGGRKLDASVRQILRIGLYQLRYLDRVPAHAVINDAVNLTHKAKKTSAKGFVNAVLRRATREDVTPAFADETERLAVETSHPRWLIEKWTRNFGTERAVRLAEAGNETPRPSFRFTAKTTDAVRESAVRSADDAAFLRELALGGKIYFQDEGSQVVGNAVALGPGARFLDVCASPGSKTTQVAAAATDGSALIVAGDFASARVELLRDNCRRQGAGEVAVVRYDAATALPFEAGAFDVVLVDAPCSGTGTIRHNPEIRYFLQPGDFASLFEKQLAILREASKVVRRGGGRLIYSTCSLEREENEDVCLAFLAGAPGFVRSVPRVPPELLTPDGFARTFPDTGAGDGFFIAEFELKADSDNV